MFNCLFLSEVFSKLKDEFPQPLEGGTPNGCIALLHSETRGRAARAPGTDFFAMPLRAAALV
jgi:hypothetical protein